MPLQTGISLGKILLPALGVPIERCTGAVIILPVHGVAEITATFAADGDPDADLLTRRFRVIEIKEGDDESQ